MTTRTFKQLGIAFGAEPANITAKIDNAVVYQGPITTINEPFPDLPNLSYVVTNELFSWTTDITFSGPQTLEIDVDGTVTLLVTEIRANYTQGEYQGNIISSGANTYVPFEYTQFGNTYINETLQGNVVHGNLTGQWWWPLPPNGNFVEEITIIQGLE
jgi:hypothetical protein